MPRSQYTDQQKRQFAQTAVKTSDEAVAQELGLHPETIRGWRMKFGLTKKRPTVSTVGSADTGVADGVQVGSLSGFEPLNVEASAAENKPPMSVELTGQTTRKAKNLTEHSERMTGALKDLFARGGFQRLRQAKKLSHGYSLRNLCLIMWDLPDATFVLPKSKWEALGRTMKADAQGAMVCAPTTRMITREDKDGNEEKVPVTRFVMNDKTVTYDVSETEGPDIMGITTPLSDPVGAPENVEQMKDNLTSVARNAGLNVRYESMRQAKSGHLSRKGNEIVLNSEKSDAEQAACLAHELGHYFDPVLVKNPEAYSKYKDDCEAVAEMVSLVMCDEHNIEALESSAEYIGAYNPERVYIANMVLKRVEAATREIKNNMNDLGLESVISRRLREEMEAAEKRAKTSMGDAEIETARQQAEEVLSRSDLCTCDTGQVCYPHDVEERLGGLSTPESYEARYVAFQLCALNGAPGADTDDMDDWSAIFAQGTLTG